MNFKNIAILTSKESWFIPYSKEFVKSLNKKGYRAKLFNKHQDINEKYEIIYILSYFKIFPLNILNKRKYNLVVHESELPKGKGWSPISWQILEGKNIIPVSLFNADASIDSGEIYIKDKIILSGSELNPEIKKLQAEKTLEMCYRFLKEYKTLSPEKQIGKSTTYKRRMPSDSEININKSIKEQFNLLRIADNQDYPAHFYYKDNKYILKIFKDENKK